MSMRSVFIAFACLFIPSQMVYAKSTYSVSCPAAITTTETINTIPANWQVSKADHAHPWQAVTFYDGHPRDNASLAPDKSNKQSASWQFSGTNDIYVSCGYYRSAIELIQILPKKVKGCVVMYDAMSYGDQGLVPKKINCAD